MPKHLNQLLKDITILFQSSDENPLITNLCFDSRNITNGCLFFALPGTHVHGNKFIKDALCQGASAIVYQDTLPEEAIMLAKGQQNTAVFIQVENSRFAMSPISSAFYDNPSSKLAIIGVTGTEGKSSTVSFIWQFLNFIGKKAGFISTVEYSLGGKAIANPEHQTTPEAPIIQKKLSDMVEAGCHYAVIESSSHGLSPKTNRLGNVLFDSAVWMNITHEHLEFHGSIEQYKNDKLNLFKSLDTHNHKKIIEGKEQVIQSFGVINLEDSSAHDFVKATQSKVYGFTTQGVAGRGKHLIEKNPPQIPSLLAHNITESHNLTFTLSGNIDELQKDISITTSIHGAFNVYNITAAIITVNKITNHPIEDIAQKARQLIPVIGRMTSINQNQPFEVIVDYAHTPSSFETIFPPLRRRTQGNILAVFGSGGERDIQKRPEQGRIAAQWCDILILTDEDPRHEDSLKLLQMIAEGAKSKGKVSEETGLYIIPHRQKALRKAFSLAKAGDIVLLLGKAHENSIIYKDFIMPYDEIAEAKKALSEMGFKYN